MAVQKISTEIRGKTYTAVVNLVENQNGEKQKEIFLDVCAKLFQKAMNSQKG